MECDGIRERQELIGKENGRGSIQHRDIKYRKKGKLTGVGSQNNKQGHELIRKQQHVQFFYPFLR
jgi:hypothetical protein